MVESRDWMTNSGGSEGKSLKGSQATRTHDFQSGMMAGYYKDKDVFRNRQKGSQEYKAIISFY